MLVTVASARRQRGFTLIEILVTLLIVSSGLLGFAALLNKSIVSNRHAYLVSQATMLAYDLTERMRANRAGALGGVYTLATRDAASHPDARDWVETLADALPDGDAAVSTAPSGDGLAVTITIKWVDGQRQSFTTQTTI
ncbi:MAG TPA: type IV pilus modification protein PilV [Ramlibacter sp.]